MLEMRILSPLAKVFPDDAPQPCCAPFEGMRNETVSFQLAFRPESAEDGARPWVKLEIDSPGLRASPRAPREARARAHRQTSAYG